MNKVTNVTNVFGIGSCVGYREAAEVDSLVCQALISRLEEELKAAKSAQLACGEVLIPADLLSRIASDILRKAEREPCGLR